MNKKMYYHPATEITEIESQHVIMEGTVSPEPQKPQEDVVGGEAAPQRYPRY